MSIEQTIQRIKEKGFAVWAPAPLTSYAYFTDGKRIGYVQYNRMNGVEFSTVHKPSTQVGTGFKADSIEEALQHWPQWAYQRDREQVKKYDDFEAFKRKHWQPLVQY